MTRRVLTSYAQMGLVAGTSMKHESIAMLDGTRAEAVICVTLTNGVCAGCVRHDLCRRMGPGGTLLFCYRCIKTDRAGAVLRWIRNEPAPDDPKL